MIITHSCAELSVQTHHNPARILRCVHARLLRQSVRSVTGYNRRLTLPAINEPLLCIEPNRIIIKCDSLASKPSKKFDQKQPGSLRSGHQRLRSFPSMPAAIQLAYNGNTRMTEAFRSPATLNLATAEADLLQLCF